MKKKNGLIQTFVYVFLKMQVTNWVREILVTCKNQIVNNLLIFVTYTVIIYKFTQGNLGAKKIASSRFQSPVEKQIANCDIGDRQRDPWESVKVRFLPRVDSFSFAQEPHVVYCF